MFLVRQSSPQHLVAFGVGGSRVLWSEAETPPLAGTCVRLGASPSLFWTCKGPRLRRDVRALARRRGGHLNAPATSRVLLGRFLIKVRVPRR